MAEIGKATIKVVPDVSEFGDVLATLNASKTTSGLDFALYVAGTLLILCLPAIVWAVYGWAF